MHVNTRTRTRIGRALQAYLVHALHPCSENHASYHTRGTLASEQLPPGICVAALLVHDVLDNGILGADGRAFDGCAVAFESSKNFKRFLVSFFSNKQTR